MKRRPLVPSRRSQPLERERWLNCVLTPHRRLSREASEMPHTLRAERSALRPVWAYLGPASAEAYRLYVRRCPEAQERAARLDLLATLIGPHQHADPLDVLVLGTGEGREDVLLATRLLAASDPSSSLGLVDLSEPLLTAAYVHASESLPHVAVWALLADLEELSSHADLLSLSGRQRVIVLLGGTLGELEDELRFLRYGLAFCGAGDVLVLDLPLSSGESQKARWARQGEAAQRRLDEAKPWLAAALAPYAGGEPIEWTLRLDPDAALLGSYAWSAVALFPGESPPREIELWRCKHYQPASVSGRLGALGWEQVAACRYGEALPGELQVYRRCGAVGYTTGEAP
ncbi:MAG: L-histidine N(alpha)-methyltransferase [Polyangia bacterium]